MAVFKCKMCGASLEVKEGQKIVKCDFCGATQTVYGFETERKEGLFKRANALRFKCEFDKAAVLYETIISEFPKEAEAYWGLVLCKYGIEYVSDDKEHKIVPTCHRTQFSSIFEDADYKGAVKYADPVAKDIYEKEATEIAELQKNILEISSKADPFDIFICYKENDDRGRTKDSVMAQEIYEKLTEKGYRVFFSRITLEDKLGTAYEPYIFAALHSSKVMLHVTTCAEHSESLWVRNEWSRYLDLIKRGQKKTLIPVFKDLIDVYDLPDEMENLQGVDMSKIGAIQDLVRGIGKIIKPSGNNVQEVKNVIQSTNSPVYEGWLRKGKAYLEHGDFNKANDALDSAIFCSPLPGEAYFYKLIAEFQCMSAESLIDRIGAMNIFLSPNYKFAKEMADECFKKQFDEFENQINKKVYQQLYTKGINLIVSTNALIVQNGIDSLAKLPPDYPGAEEALIKGKINYCELMLKTYDRYEEGDTIVSIMNILKTLPQDNTNVVAMVNKTKEKLQAVKDQTKKSFFVNASTYNRDVIFCLLNKYKDNLRVASAFEPDDEEINEPCRAANKEIIEDINEKCKSYAAEMTTIKSCKDAITVIDSIDDEQFDKEAVRAAVTNRKAAIVLEAVKKERRTKLACALFIFVPIVLAIVLLIINVVV